ncbi:YafY family transcriptional regulator [Rhodanobacter glycinis]|uniref:helix-turn-helix transcriptional regulator n=1 Tax=Rhodanobacter glycinis TaxID=582702 RepID=UPI0011271C56|nr:YafY family protein [Rhodanobacter glycinis]TPG51065.1 YafY family transcriptional regulator [Rhodanobacter glycinis]
MAKPTTRVLAVLDLLQSHGRMSGPELAQRVGVDVRTLRRYMVMLEDLGIPLTTERGRHGAYMLVAGFKLPPMMFTNDEAVALSVGMVAARGLGLADAAPAVASVQAKLARVMPDSLKRHVSAIADTVKVDLQTSSTTPGSNAALMALTTAAQSQQRVSMSYDSAQGSHTERQFDPYGLVYRAGGWYALGMCHLRNGLRSFRLDRVGKVTLLDRHFKRPANFDALDQLVQSIASMPRGRTIEVLLRTELQTAQNSFSLAFGVFEPVKDGVLLHTSADDLAWFARRLAALPFDFEIRTPAELRTELTICAVRLQALAEDGSRG